MKNSKKGDKMGKCSMITGGLVLGVALVGGVLSGSVVNAEGDSAVDDVTITVPTACTMSGVVDSAHTTSMQAATYSGTGGIGKTTLTTHCNDNNGFSIYAVGFTNDTDGTNTLVGTTSSQTINTGIYTSGATDSSWSMKVSKVTDSSESYNPQNMTITNSFDNWHTVPTSYTKVAEYHAATGSSTTDTVLGAKVETTYDAYISRTQTADTYTGKVKYVMVHPYDDVTPVIPDLNACNTPVPDLTYMQDLNSSNKATVLASMVEDQQYFLKDKRDEKSYCVSKLKDGNIWMTQDLDHDIVTTQNYYNNNNTDIGWNNSTSSYDTATWTANRATQVVGTGPTDPDYEQQSFDLGNIYVDSGYIDSWVSYYNTCDRGTLDNCDSSLRPNDDSSTPVLTGSQHYRVGNYYNWSAAIAMNDTRSYKSDIDLNQSICPANWTLPKNGNSSVNGSIRFLLNQYGYNDDTHLLGGGYVPYSSPLYLNLPGIVYQDGAHYFLGSCGMYWSPTPDTGYSAFSYNTHINNTPYEDYYFDGTIYARFDSYRSDLNPIRCVSR